jgi:hypothetical protein
LIYYISILISLFDKFDLSTYFNSVSTSAMAEAVETTTFGSANKTYAVGMRDGTVSLEGLWAGDVSGVDEVLATSVASTSSALAISSGAIPSSVKIFSSS